jgi:hypothetical protein
MRQRQGRGWRVSTARRPPAEPVVLDRKEPDSSVCCLFCRRCVERNLMFCAPRTDDCVCYRPGADGPLGRRPGCWYGRCLPSCHRLGAVCAACRSSALASAGGLVAPAISRSRRCFHRAGSVSSWVPPVGRWSWGLMLLAARHTAISPMRVVLSWLPGTAQIGWASAWQAWSWIWLARSATSWDRFAR